MNFLLYKKGLYLKIVVVRTRHDEYQYKKY